MKLNVLLVGGSQTSRDVTLRQLQQWGFHVEEADSGKDALEILVQLAASARRPNIVLMEWLAPELGGVAACKWIKSCAAYKAGPHVYVFFLATHKDTENETMAFKAGADGYIVHGSWEELEAKLNAVRERIHEEYELRYAIANLQKDPSGVLVRREIIDRLGRRVMQPDPSPLGIMLMDINDFKAINDRYGHIVGDQILEAVGRRLQECVRSGIVGRYGGDEFLVGLPGCDRETTERRAGDIAARLTADPVVTTAGDIAISICYGTAAATEPVRLESLIEVADKALYERKSYRRKLPALSPF